MSENVSPEDRPLAEQTGTDDLPAPDYSVTDVEPEQESSQAAGDRGPEDEVKEGKVAEKNSEICTQSYSFDDVRARLEAFTKDELRVLAASIAGGIISI